MKPFPKEHAPWTPALSHAHLFEAGLPVGYTLARMFNLLFMTVRKLDEIAEQPKPGFTVRRFSEATGLSPRTIRRLIAEGELRTKWKLIPYSELIRHFGEPLRRQRKSSI